ncbi:MAG: GAF domain-containing protein, partial [Chloroflexota bacterium]
MVTGKSMASRVQDLGISAQDVMNAVEDELAIIDSKHRVKLANLSVRSKFKDGTESPIGKPCYKVIHGGDKPCSSPLWICPLREVLESGATRTAVYPVRILGAEKYVKVTAYPMRDSRGKITTMLEMRRDVSAERELETQILRRHHQLLALNHVASAMSGLWRLDDVLHIALDNVLEVVNGTIGGILLLDEETQTLHYRTQRGLSARYAEEMRMGLGEGIAGRVAQTGKPMVLEDVSKAPLTSRPDLVTVEGLKGFLSIPLKA